MKKVLLTCIFMVGIVLYFKHPPLKAVEPAKQKPVIKETYAIDIKALQEYNKKEITNIVAKRKAAEKQMEALENKVVALKKDNASLLKKINNLENTNIKEPILDTLKKDTVKIKKKRNIIQKILNKQ